MDHSQTESKESGLDGLVQLDDRRKMETSQELSRIDQMGKVKRSLRAGKIARNLLTKLQNGPLGEPSKGLVHPPSQKNSSRSRDRHDGISKEDAKLIKRLSKHIKASRNEELESIRNMKLVQAGRADRESRRRARRLFNHRVYVNSHQHASKHGDHKKSSILVTQSELVPDKMEASNFIRQESQHVINNFFKIPSRRQRVLQRLNSEGKHNILTTDMSKSGGHHDEQEDDKEPMGEEPVQKAEEESKRGHRRGLHGRFKRKKHKKLKRKRWSGGNLIKKLKTWKESSSPEIVTMVDASKKGEITSPETDAGSSAFSDHVVTKQHSKERESPLSPIPPSPPSLWTTLPPSFGFSGPPPPPSKAPPSLTPDNAPPSKSLPPPKTVSVSLPSADIPQQNPLFSAHFNGLPNGDSHSQDLMDTVPSLSSQENIDVSDEKKGSINVKENEHLLMSEEQYEERVLEVDIHATAVEDYVELGPWEDVYELTEVEVDMYTHASGTMVASEDDDSPPQSEDETEDAESTATGGEQTEGDKEPSSMSSLASQPHYKRYFSSPQLSVTLPSENENLFDTHVIGPLQQTPIPHGYYTPMSVDVNPFKFNEEDRVVVDHSTPADDDSVAAKTLSSASKPKRRQPSVTEEATLKEIPARAFTNPNFIKYVKALGREPLLEDYISFQLCMIGDQIDRKYDVQINQALDAVLMDIVKSTVSWQNFSAVSKRLLLEGQRVQDGLFMIPCFGRRLCEVMPQFGETISYFTQQVMNQYAADILLSMGGWNTLMESYSQVEVYEEEYPDLYDDMQGPVCAAAVDHLYDLDIPPIIVEEHTSHTDVAHGQQQISQQTPSTHYPFRSPTLLRRTVSVEVLFQETSDQTDSSTSPEIDSRNCSIPHFLPRSLSTSSLDTLTPGTATFFDYPGVFHYHSQLSRTEKKIQQDQVITVETINEECYLTQRRHSRQSSFSSTFSATSVNIVGNPEIVARGGRILTPAAVSPSEELPDIFLSPSPTRSNTRAFREKEREARHGVVLKIAVPMATVAVAVGAVALGYYYLSRRK